MDTLESIVETSLPAFLRPAEIIAVTELPRLVSGKIDVRSLPQPGSQVGEPVDSHVAHVTEALRSVWMEVLDLDAVGDDDGFFALGGHSLLAIRVISRIRDRLGVELPLPSLFTHPKLSELAALTADLVSPTGGYHIRHHNGGGGRRPRCADLRALRRRCNGVACGPGRGTVVSKRPPTRLPADGRCGSGSSGRRPGSRGHRVARRLSLSPPTARLVRPHRSSPYAQTAWQGAIE